MIHQADCLDALREMDADSVDACVCDPPYGIGFMGHDWDKPGVDRSYLDRRPQDGGRFMRERGPMPSYTLDQEYQAWCEQWATELLRVLKPGAYLIAFSATRTYHRLACGIQDAGFVPRDMIEWLYGSGFPKSHNDGDGHGTALKPSHEPMMLAQVPREGTYAANADKYGVGYLNIEDARVPLNGDSVPAFDRTGSFIFPQGGGDDYTTNRTGEQTNEGRWPANVCHDGSDAVIASLPNIKSGLVEPHHHFHGDAGNAARYFYCAKPSTAEKEAGLDAFDAYESHELNGRSEDSAGNDNPRAGISKSNPRRNTHATIKPIELMRWLIRLVVPVNGVVIDPFLGSGTTAIAAVLEGRQWIGIEREAEYAAIAQARVDWWSRQRKGLSVAEILRDVPKPQVDGGRYGDLFA